VCNACKTAGRKLIDIDWGARAIAFNQIIESAKQRSNRFDCVIPVNGGKDSTWQVVKCLESGLRPLAVTWKTSVRAANGQRNLKILVRLGMDHIDWQVNPEVENSFLQCFRTPPCRSDSDAHGNDQYSHLDSVQIQHTAGHMGRELRI